MDIADISEAFEALSLTSTAERSTVRRTDSRAHMHTSACDAYAFHFVLRELIWFFFGLGVVHCLKLWLCRLQSGGHPDPDL